MRLSRRWLIEWIDAPKPTSASRMCGMVGGLWARSDWQSQAPWRRDRCIRGMCSCGLLRGPQPRAAVPVEWAAADSGAAVESLGAPPRAIPLPAPSYSRYLPLSRQAFAFSNGRVLG
jgi:hypothetical protein